ncbi:MAG: energy-coupling factor transporter transmembrane component T family protein [Spirochaetaceae bacterium]
MKSFAYLPGDSCVHRLDPRVKLLLLAAFSVAAVVFDHAAPLLLLTLALFAIYAAGGYSPLRALLAARLFLFLAAAVVLSHAVDGGSLSASGAARGALFAWGFLLIVLAAELTIRTTPTERVADVLHWLLRPIPGVNAGRIALMSGIAVRHAQVLAEVHRHLTEALRARGIVPRRMPARTVRVLGLALLRETLHSAELTSDALLARGYSDDRTPPAFSPRRADAVAATLVAGLIAAAAALSAVVGPLS